MPDKVLSDEHRTSATGILNLLLKALIYCVVPCLFLQSCERSVAPSEKPEALKVVVVALIETDLPLISEMPGRTFAYRIAEVRPQVGGIVAQRLFVEGSEVAAGDLLYQIDPGIYQADLNRAVAATARAEALLSAAHLKADRFQDLIGQKMISQQDYDDADAALRVARANVVVAKAEQELASINFEYTAIKAPISGRIGKSFVTDGALVEAEQESPIAVIRQIDPLYVELSQSSKELTRIKRQQASGKLQNAETGEKEVRLILEDDSEYVHIGRLQFSEVSVAESTGSVTLRATVPNPDGVLLPGLFVRARVLQGIRKAVILAPQQGITFDYSGNAIAMVVGEGSLVEQRMVKTGQAIGDHWLVLDGLGVGDQVIVEGLQRIRPGVKVNPVQALASADGSAN